jgi:V/A-type H+-transporting ATPase subunit E
VNSKLNSQGKKGMVKISSETRNIRTGFVLKRGGLEINCSIESQIRILRDSLEGEIANLLFEGR